MDAFGHVRSQGFLHGTSTRVFSVFSLYGQDLILVHEGENPEVFGGIIVRCVDPVLVEFVGACSGFVNPNVPAFALPEFRAVRLGNERGSQCKSMALTFSANEFRSRGHVSPLVTSAHLKQAVVRLPEVEEVISLNQLIAEFCEAHATFQSVFYRLFCGHVVHGDVLADIPDKVEKAEVFEPIVVVDHLSGIGPFKVQKALQLRLLAVQVVLQNFEVEELPLCSFPTGVAHHSCGAADQSNGSVSSALEVDQEHHRHEVANVQRVSRGVKAHVACCLFLAQLLLESGHGVVQHAAPLEFRYEIHGCKGKVEGCVRAQQRVSRVAWIWSLLRGWFFPVTDVRQGGLGDPPDFGR